MSPRHSMLGVTAVASALLVGCVVGVPFDPLGDAVSVRGSWQLQADDSPRAATEESCARLGVDTVQLQFIDDADRERRSSPEQFRFDCSQGEFSTENVLSEGLFRVRWLALDAEGEQVGTSVVQNMDTVGETSVTVPVSVIMLDDDRGDGDFEPVTGTDVSLEGDWTINGGDATSETCGDAGIATVELHLFDDAGTELDVEQLAWPCENGRFSTAPSKVLAHGTYQTQWQGFDGEGAMVAEGTRQTLDATSGEHVQVRSIDFVAGDAGTLTVNLEWEQNPDPGGTFVDCASAEVDTMTWTLLRSDESEVDRMSEMPCDETLTLGDLPYDTYSLEISGLNDKDQWGVICDGMELASETAAYRCQVEHLGSL